MFGAKSVCRGNMDDLMVKIEGKEALIDPDTLVRIGSSSALNLFVCLFF